MLNNKILLLHDNLNFFTSIYGSFAANFKVFLSNTPAYALQILKQNAPFAAVVADYDLSTRNWLNFFEQLRSISPRTQLILLVSASDVSPIITAVNTGKIDSFLQKPHTTDELISIITSAVTLYNTLVPLPMITIPPHSSKLFPPQHYQQSGGICHNIQGLTPREQEILTMIANGESNQSISVSLGLTLGTVKSHCRNIFNKLGVSSRTQAIATFYSIKN